MFEDEKPELPLVDPVEFQVLANLFQKNKNRPWTAQEAEGVYNHLETMLFQMSMFEMALEGYVVMTFNGKEVLYAGTEAGEKLAENHMNQKDQKAIENLLKGID